MVGAASGGARAADVPARPVFFDPEAPPATFAPSFPPPQATTVFVPPPPPVFDWTGLYLGLNAGYVFDGRRAYGLGGTDAAAIAGLQNGSVPSGAIVSAGGFTGGGQVGINKQLDPMMIPPLGKLGAAVVLGVEADAAYTDLDASSTFVGGATSTTLHARTDFVGTARGRIGIAYQNLLVYGTGGFAYGSVDNAATITGLVNYAGAGSSLRTGYAYGGGIAYAFPATALFTVLSAPAVTVKLEYLHYDLGVSSFVATNFVDAYNVRNADSANIIRVGINYKFKIPPPPY